MKANPLLELESTAYAYKYTPSFNFSFFFILFYAISIHTYISNNYDLKSVCDEI